MAIGANLVPSSQAGDTQSGAGTKPMEFTDATFIDQTKNGMVFVDFWAEWCGPCKMVAPVIEKLAQKWQGKIKFGQMNVDDQPATPGRYGILSIPTFYLFYNGQKVAEIVGAGPEQVFENFLQENYAKYAGGTSVSEKVEDESNKPGNIIQDNFSSSDDDAMKKAAA